MEVSQTVPRLEPGTLELTNLASLVLYEICCGHSIIFTIALALTFGLRLLIMVMQLHS
jgi:hypothetical protein